MCSCGNPLMATQGDPMRYMDDGSITLSLANETENQIPVKYGSGPTTITQIDYYGLPKPDQPEIAPGDTRTVTINYTADQPNIIVYFWPSDAKTGDHEEAAVLINGKTGQPLDAYIRYLIVEEQGVHTIIIRQGSPQMMTLKNNTNDDIYYGCGPTESKTIEDPKHGAKYPSVEGKKSVQIPGEYQITKPQFFVNMWKSDPSGSSNESPDAAIVLNLKSQDALDTSEKSGLELDYKDLTIDLSQKSILQEWWFWLLIGLAVALVLIIPTIFIIRREIRKR